MRKKVFSLELERGQTSVAATGIMSALAARVLILLVYGELWVGLPGLLLLDVMGKENNSTSYEPSKVLCAFAFFFFSPSRGQIFGISAQ